MLDFDLDGVSRVHCFFRCASRLMMSKTDTPKPREWVIKTNRYGNILSVDPVDMGSNLKPNESIYIREVIKTKPATAEKQARCPDTVDAFTGRVGL